MYEQSNGLNDVLKKTFAVLYSYMIHEMNTPMPGRGALHNHAMQRDATVDGRQSGRTTWLGRAPWSVAVAAFHHSIEPQRGSDVNVYIFTLCTGTRSCCGGLARIGSDGSNRTLPVPFSVVPDAAQQSTASQSVFQYSTVW